MSRRVAAKRRQVVRRREVRCFESELAHVDSDLRGSRARIVGHVIEFAVEHGIDPSEAEQLRRQIRKAWWNEDVTELLEGDDPRRPSLATVRRVFSGVPRLPLHAWTAEISRRAGAAYPGLEYTHPALARELEANDPAKGVT